MSLRMSYGQYCIIEKLLGQCGAPNVRKTNLTKFMVVTFFNVVKIVAFKNL